MSREDREGDDLIFFSPRRIREKREERIRIKRPFPPSEIIHSDSSEDSKWREEGVYNQIAKTYDKIIEKKIKDENLGYHVLETVNDIYHPSSLRVLDILNAKILFHIIPSKSRVFVETKLNKLNELVKEKHLKFLNNNIHLIRPLTPSEIFSDVEIDEDWLRSNPKVVVEIIPHIDHSKRNDYINKTLEYLTQIGIEIVETPSEEYLRKQGIIIATASLNQSRELAENNNFIYKIFKTQKLKAASNGINNITVNENRNNNIESKYKVCVVDTGIKIIQQLQNVVESITYESEFNNGDDLDNHGTPISCLIAHGEGRNYNPSFKIISHRVFSNRLNRGDLFNGLINAVELYENNTKVFISSCNFLFDNEEVRNITERLNKYIQEKNICVVFCSGNIEPPYISRNYPTYIESYKVNHPSDAINITSVGSIVKKVNNQCFAPINGPSPFTRCGSLTDLGESVKPEVVQHGGNCTNMGIQTGIGVETFSNMGSPYEARGTSFSSPLFARVLANIYQKYGISFQNSETAKAIAYSSSRKYSPQFSKYLGFGESRFIESIKTSWNSAKMVFEGSLPLQEIENGQEFYNKDIIRFNVPAYVSELNLTIVHSDNYFKFLEEPKLHSYIYIKTWKPGRESPVRASEVYPGNSAHAKKMYWRYSRGTVGSWKFEIYPKSLDIPKNERDGVIIRYGGLIELIARRSTVDSLTQRFKVANGL